jgi:hypothetical protein
MVFVKKSNGQFTSMPLTQLKKKTSGTSEVVAVPSKALSPVSAPLLLSNESPVSKQSPSLPSKKISAEDFSSPLEEELEPGSKITTSQKSFADTHVVHVLSSLSFSVPADYENRLRTVVQLCIKQVRTDDQTREVCQRSLKEGGLGLDSKQTEDIVRFCHEELKTMHPEFGVNLPATVTPFNTFKHAIKTPTTSLRSSVSSAKNTAISPTPEVQKKNRERMNNAAVSRLDEDRNASILRSASAGHRPLMNDITYKPLAIGPIEEIRMITLSDVRQLAPVTGDALARFGQKFINLKNESVLLFFEAREAYHKGVLFEEYTSLLWQSLIEHQSLENIVHDSQGWKLNELEELVRVEKNLGL